MDTVNHNSHLPEKSIDPPSPVQMSSHDTNGQGISGDDGRNNAAKLSGTEKRKFEIDDEDGEPPGKMLKCASTSLTDTQNGNREMAGLSGDSSNKGLSTASLSPVPEASDIVGSASDILSCSITAINGSTSTSCNNDEFEADTGLSNSELTDTSKISTSNSELTDTSKISTEPSTLDTDGSLVERGGMSEETEGDEHRGGEEFEIIDDIEPDDLQEYSQGSEEQNEDGYDSDDLDDSEIYAWLEEGIEKKGPAAAGGTKNQDEAENFIEREKVVLKEKGHNPFEVLPEGWVAVTHNSSMPVYLHRQSRVCTLSRPYFLGPGSVRKHNIPVSAIPCLQYRQEIEKEQTQPVADDTLTQETDVSKEGAEPSQSAGHGACVVPTVEVTECKDMEITLEPEGVHEYCAKLFEFQTIKIKKFKTWKEKRKHQNSAKQQQICQSLPSSTKLITCPIPQDNTENRSTKRKEFVLNPTGKSHLCILHEYAQHVLRVQPKYIFRELENAQTPYSATVVINEIEYGTGKASSKKAAKLEAAKVTLNILIPKLLKVLDEDKTPKDDLVFFDEINIEDPRVSDLCNKAALQNPYQILLECLKRNWGMGDTRCQVEKKMLPNQKCEFTIAVGKHTASVVCRNKREGKQRAAQAMLQLLHPLIKSWGSILRLYGDSSNPGFKERERPVTELQSKASKVNNVILDRLKESMRKLKEQKDAIKSKGTLRVSREQTAGSVVGIDL